MEIPSHPASTLLTYPLYNRSRSVIGAITSMIAYYKTKNVLWLVPVATHGATLLWTVGAMGGIIGKLMASKHEEVAKLTHQFCVLHYPRILFAGVGFVVSLQQLATGKSP